MLIIIDSITSITYDEGLPEEETVKIVEVSMNGTKLRETFTYPSAWTEAMIDADIRDILGARGYEV